jgi:hypothetical protein
MTADPGYSSDDNEVAQPLGGTFEHLSPTALTLGDNAMSSLEGGALRPPPVGTGNTPNWYVCCVGLAGVVD